MKEPIRVLLVDSDKDTREELSKILGDDGDMIVVGETKSGETVLAEAEKLSPELVILFAGDGRPDRNIADTTLAINAARLPSMVIIVTDNPLRYLIPTIRAGAAGLVGKHIGYDRLLSTIRKIRLWSDSSYPSE